MKKFLALLLAALLVAAPVFALTQGPNNPATASGWTSSTNVFASDDARATNFIAFGEIGGTLSVTNFSFSIPTGSTLNGIVAEYERSATGTGIIEDFEIKLTGVTGASANEAVGGAWTGADTYASRGGSADLWSTTPTVSEINASTFGVLITAQETGAANNATARIDHVRITVSYTAAAGKKIKVTQSAQTRDARVLRKAA